MGPDKGHLGPQLQGVPGSASHPQLWAEVLGMFPPPAQPSLSSSNRKAQQSLIPLGSQLRSVLVGLTGDPASAIVDTTNHVTQATPYYRHENSYRQLIHHNTYHTDTTTAIPHMHIYSHIRVDVICTQLAHTTHMNSLIAHDPPTLHTNHVNTCVTPHTVLIRHTYTGLLIPLTHKYSHTLFHTHYNIDYTETSLPHTNPYLYVNI